MIKNTYGIRKITIKAETKCYCPLGHDWYTNHFEIEMEPDKAIPDYCAVDNWIKENLSGKHHIVESAVCELHAYICANFAPHSCVVRSYVDDAAHSTVIVEKY